MHVIPPSAADPSLTHTLTHDNVQIHTCIHTNTHTQSDMSMCVKGHMNTDELHAHTQGEREGDSQCGFPIMHLNIQNVD